jgi:hypothetical protein
MTVIGFTKNVNRFEARAVAVTRSATTRRAIPGGGHIDKGIDIAAQAGSSHQDKEQGKIVGTPEEAGSQVVGQGDGDERCARSQARSVQAA